MIYYKTLPIKHIISIDSFQYINGWDWSCGNCGYLNCAFLSDFFCICGHFLEDAIEHTVFHPCNSTVQMPLDIGKCFYYYDKYLYNLKHEPYSSSVNHYYSKFIEAYNVVYNLYEVKVG